jgi:hypothetical protein
MFGAPQVEEFCRNNALDLITRSHQFAMDSFKWFFDKKLVTVWSTPNYIHRSGNNATVLNDNPNSRSHTPSSHSTHGPQATAKCRRTSQRRRISSE